VVKSNLLQSWAYGKAKEESEGWRVKRGVIRRNGNIIAIFQALEKSWFFLGVIRINRGPMLINGNDDFETKYNVYKILRKTWRLSKGRILLVAPALYDTPENRAILQLVGFRKRDKIHWQSSWMNLNKSKEELRKQLSKNWRRNLSRAEKNELTIESDNKNETFSWILKLYKEMQVKKKFSGVPCELLIELRKELLQSHEMYLFIVQNNDGDPLAVHIVVRHGLASIPLVSWRSKKGQKLYAPNYILWNIILAMKDLGVQWFDHGGINDIDTPEVAQFKRGLKGEEYTLVGEWI